jgi:hypothetical protein
MRLAKLSRGVDVGEEGVDNHLHGLAIFMYSFSLPEKRSCAAGRARRAGSLSSRSLNGRDFPLLR